MHKFEELLTDKGYKVFEKSLDDKGKLIFIEPTTNYYSSMGNLTFTYIKGDRKVEFGLSEYGKPPTLVWPRPTILKREGDVVKAGYSLRDDSVSRILQTEDLEKVYESLFNNSIIFYI